MGRNEKAPRSYDYPINFLYAPTIPELISITVHQGFIPALSSPVKLEQKRSIYVHNKRADEMVHELTTESFKANKNTTLKLLCKKIFNLIF